jgi:hypothetical protein
MPNTNCLEGFRCPECGEEGPFFVEVTKQVLLTDSGSEECGSDEYWNADSYCRCFYCDHEGTIKDFDTGYNAEEN